MSTPIVPRHPFTSLGGPQSARLIAPADLILADFAIRADVLPFALLKDGAALPSAAAIAASIATTPAGAALSGPQRLQYAAGFLSTQPLFYGLRVDGTHCLMTNPLEAARDPRYTLHSIAVGGLPAGRLDPRAIFGGTAPDPITPASTDTALREFVPTLSSEMRFALHGAMTAGFAGTPGGVPNIGPIDIATHMPRAGADIHMYPSLVAELQAMMVAQGGTFLALTREYAPGFSPSGVVPIDPNDKRFYNAYRFRWFCGHVKDQLPGFACHAAFSFHPLAGGVSMYDVADVAPRIALFVEDGPAAVERLATGYVPGSYVGVPSPLATVESRRLWLAGSPTFVANMASAPFGISLHTVESSLKAIVPTVEVDLEALLGLPGAPVPITLLEDDVQLGDMGWSYVVPTGYSVLQGVHPVSDFLIELGRSPTRGVGKPVDGFSAHHIYAAEAYSAVFEKGVLEQIYQDMNAGREGVAAPVIASTAADLTSLFESVDPVLQARMVVLNRVIDPRENAFYETALYRVCRNPGSPVDILAAQYDGDDTFKSVRNRSNALTGTGLLGWAWLEGVDGSPLAKFAEVQTPFTPLMARALASGQAVTVVITPTGAVHLLITARSFLDWFGTSAILATAQLPMALAPSAPEIAQGGQLWHEINLLADSGAEVRYIESDTLVNVEYHMFTDVAQGARAVAPASADVCALASVLTLGIARTAKLLVDVELAARQQTLPTLLADRGHPALLVSAGAASWSTVDWSGPLSMGLVAERSERVFTPLYLSGRSVIMGEHAAQFPNYVEQAP